MRQISDGCTRPRVHWCPTSIFSALPLHAAGIYNVPSNQRICCGDYVVSSYTPTLTTLLRAQRALPTPLARRDLSLALVAEKRAYDPKLLTIPYVEDEMKGIKTVAESQSIPLGYYSVGATTIEGTSDAMKTANIVHLACHGTQDVGDATQSGFCLSDGRLTISHLVGLHLKDGFLAFLSACETAAGSQEQPDQAMHLAAAMLFTGFKSVVATMWYVHDDSFRVCVADENRAITDEDGPKVAKWFYEALFANEVIDADAVPYALDMAVGKLRDSGAPTDRWVPFIHMGA